MNYPIFLGFLLAFFVSTTKAWDCAVHLIIMKIALMEMTSEERSKLTTILSGLKSGIENLTTVEAACFQEDMEEAGFTAFRLWKSYEIPFYDGIKKEEAKLENPLLDTLSGIVSVLISLE